MVSGSSTGRATREGDRRATVKTGGAFTTFFSGVFPSPTSLGFQIPFCSRRALEGDSSSPAPAFGSEIVTRL